MNEPVNSDATAACDEMFVQRLTGAQSQLYAFICSLLAGTREAADVLQETNMVLWKKANQYDLNRDFLGWAYTFARFQVLAHCKRTSRSRLVFDAQLLDTIAAAAGRKSVVLDDRLRALDGCIEKLTVEQRGLLHRRYRDGVALIDLAAESKQTVNGLGVALHRIRVTLARCVERTVHAGGST